VYHFRMYVFVRADGIYPKTEVKAIIKTDAYNVEYKYIYSKYSFNILRHVLDPMSSDCLNDCS